MPLIFQSANKDSLLHTETTPLQSLFLENKLSEYTDAVVGVNGIPLTQNISNNDWIPLLIIGCFLLFVFTFRIYAPKIQEFTGDLFNARPRSRYNEKTHFGISNVRIILLIQTFILEGISLYLIFQHFVKGENSTESILSTVGLFGLCSMLFYLVQYLIYQLVGYIFLPKQYIITWINTLSAITIFRGVLFFVPVLITIYHTNALNLFMGIAFSVYILTRLLFVYKGLKIFFSGIHSLIFLILYLCTLEIAPLFVIYKGLLNLFSFVELKLL